jgi:LysR family cyn operon transcriptional activator
MYKSPRRLEPLMPSVPNLGVSYLPAEANDLWFEPLYNEELRLVVATSHPLAKRRRVWMVEQHHMRMVLPKQMSMRLLLDECFEAAGATPLVVAEMNSIGPMVELIRRTKLAGIIAESAASPSADLRKHRSKTRRRFVRRAAIEEGAANSPVIEHFASIIRRAASSR